MKKIGIIGGMGPLATADLFTKIIKASDAKCDNEHIPIIIDNNTKIPDRTSAILGIGESPLEEIILSAKTLEKSGADFLIMPCNTAHYFYNDLTKAINIPVLNMIDETAKFILNKSPNIKRIALFSTIGTLKGNIYQNIFNKYNIEIIPPEEEDILELMHLIYNVIKNNQLNYNHIKIINIIEKFKEKNIDNIILGCTELPIAMNMFKIKGNFYDPTEILALSAIKKAKATP
ncbi:cysteate racemase [Cetobacterium somerae]|uniref:Aspartate racemase n=1 Tax=Cetobacterium somerae ATCC BAA-474 TaxID=1319815 RepID=U7VBP8_9FUSO|nr:amino acid racemase [Cetobacterium somerae]ERT68183.1 hypothetical protein HMPREF0202_01893 [Cetobacterium somerae ATCC BAA-474]MCQ9628380.1 amino acid racemase [Cetobacterium somerae]